MVSYNVFDYCHVLNALLYPLSQVCMRPCVFSIFNLFKHPLYQMSFCIVYNKLNVLFISSINAKFIRAISTQEIIQIPKSNLFVCHTFYHLICVNQVIIATDFFCLLQSSWIDYQKVPLNTFSIQILMALLKKASKSMLTI